MSMFKKILFPVDLSEASERIAPFVEEMAAKFEAEVHVIFVARTMIQYADVYVPSANIDNFGLEIIKGGKKKLSEFLSRAFPLRQVQSTVVSGDPGEMILDYADQQGIDLIIMGNPRQERHQPDHLRQRGQSCGQESQGTGIDRASRLGIERLS